MAAFHHVFQRAAELSFAPPPPPFLIPLAITLPRWRANSFQYCLTSKLGRDSARDVSHFCPLICLCNLQMGWILTLWGEAAVERVMICPPPSGDGQQLPAMTYFQLCVGDKRLKTWLVDYYGAKGLVRQAFWTSCAGLEHGPEEFMFSWILLLPFISLLKSTDKAPN